MISDFLLLTEKETPASMVVEEGEKRKEESPDIETNSQLSSDLYDCLVESLQNNAPFVSSFTLFSSSVLRMTLLAVRSNGNRQEVDWDHENGLHNRDIQQVQFT